MEISEVVLDTNVAMVSNGAAGHAGLACQYVCIDALDDLMESRRLLLDDKNLIIQEYGKALNRPRQPGPGDRFLQWLWRNKDNERHCRKVKITPNDERGFDEFPDDPSLDGFDPDDRKFAAVAIAAGSSPKILNASDRRSWWNYRHELRQHGVEVEFLCQDLMDQ